MVDSLEIIKLTHLPQCCKEEMISRILASSLGLNHTILEVLSMKAIVLQAFRKAQVSKGI